MFNISFVIGTSDRRPLNTCQIQICFKRYHRICPVIVLTGIYIFCKLQEAMKAVDFSKYKEVVFCGFGEPTEALDVLKQSAKLIKEKYNMPIRINTNGLGSLVNERDIVPELKGLVDTISVSLNTPNADEYHRLVRSKFGEKSFDAMIDFTKECTKYIPNVVMTTVETTITHEEEKQCQEICDRVGAKYRIRPWED